MFKPTFYDALCEILGDDAQTILVGGKTDGPISEIIFNDETEKPTNEEVNTKLASMISDWDAQEYARKRKEEYDALNQFELISDDDANGTTTHKDAITAIKTKWPKDNSGPVE